MENNFFYLLQYSNASTVDDLNEQNIINELSYLLNNTALNNDNYDIINYEWLIFIELSFKNNEQILALINKIKNNIKENYILKEKLLTRLTLQNDRPFF